METFGDSAETEPACRRVPLSELVDELEAHYKNLIDKKNELGHELVLLKKKLRSEIYQSEFELKTPNSTELLLNKSEMAAIKCRVELDIKASLELKLELKKCYEKQRDESLAFRVANENIPVANVERFWGLVRDLSNELPTVPPDIGKLCFSYRIEDLKMKLDDDNGELLFRSRTLKKKEFGHSWFNTYSEKIDRKADILRSIREDKADDISLIKADINNKWKVLWHDHNCRRLDLLNSSINERAEEIFKRDELPRIEKKTREDDEFRESLSKKDGEFVSETSRNNRGINKLKRMVKNVESLYDSNIPVSFNARRFMSAKEETEFLDQTISKGLKSEKFSWSQGTKLFP